LPYTIKEEINQKDKAMGNRKNFGFAQVLNISYEEALTKVQEASKEEDFGVLTDIDVQLILKKKLGVDFRKYVILGTCNPPDAL
jgi:uncharacterized protein (DUF302 family)